MQAQTQPTRNRERTRRTIAAILPRLVLYYNRWTGFECQAIGRQFRPMTRAEVERIAVGNEVWMDRDPIHRNGKVYGFVRERITRVERMGGDEIRLHFTSGFTTVSPQRSTHPCFAVRNHPALARLVAANPLCTRISPF
jgi:hypothetical protein